MAGRISAQCKHFHVNIQTFVINDYIANVGIRITVWGSVEMTGWILKQTFCSLSRPNEIIFVLGKQVRGTHISLPTYLSFLCGWKRVDKRVDITNCFQ